ncbi:MAG: hypothetical protein A2Y98_01805 [Candidatus Portnoybacteria bacterium RBG_19FT_COMBO_36_7]|uniref:Uncharacterized protein n=1 Tax=Candidatus Portnoybacteria bacterium RBG_19FT_COMBO_36_7 TaxID=1801992 RepID=A0A1G2F6U8_9BACT|nr:MAG: hypothetical protein A2Y98_01805 [Candidatus Portnoybacteria bacterium RBG_19FT_COMBO_36_7]
MKKGQLILQSDENLLEILITAAINQGQCQALKSMIFQLGQKFPKEAEFNLKLLAENIKAIETIIKEDLIYLCKAEIIGRIKKSQVTA